MSWESRKTGGMYYTRSRRVNGRVVRQYLGGGEVGAIAARLDSLEREKQAAIAARHRADRARFEDLDAQVASLCEVAELFARATLLAAGYHQHHRGSWRRRREQKNKE